MAADFMVHLIEKVFPFLRRRERTTFFAGRSAGRYAVAGFFASRWNLQLAGGRPC